MVKITKQLLSVMALLLVLLAATASPMLAQTEGEALVRFVHAIPGAASIDIYANDALAYADLKSGSATSYLTVPAGDYSLTVRQGGTDTVLWAQDITLASGTAQTLIAATTQPLMFEVFQDDLAPLTLGKARFTAINAIPAGPVIDVLLSDGRPVVSGLSFGQIYGTLDVPSLAYDFAVVPTGEGIEAAIIPTATYPLASGTSYTLLVFGTAQRPQVMMLSAAGGAEGAAGYLRFVHAYPGAGPADVVINDTVAITGLTYGSDATDFATLPPGEYEIAFREAGSENIVASTTVALAENQYTTVAVYPLDGAVGTETYTTDLTAISTRQSIFNVVNLLADGASATVTLNNGTALSGQVDAGQTSAAIVEPAESGATVSVTEEDSTIDLALLLDSIYGGVYYDVILVPASDGPEALLLKPVSIAQSIGSAPGEPVVIAAAPTEAVTDAPTELSEAEVALTEVAPAPTEAAPTPEPAVATPEAPTPVPPTPTPAPTQGPPLARVLLDPGANLQMRQYPSSTALSLGLAPSGSTLTVVGRQGAPTLLPFETPNPEATEWVDPVSLLGEGEQLDRLETWLFVSYETDDGGQIDAWVNSHYVSVNRENGDIVPLRSLPTVPSNRAGETFNTVVGVPTTESPVPLAIVGGLDEGVNLQIRRTPDISGESLALVANDTALELVGMNEQRSWAFVRYETETGSVTGWANALFLVEYNYQDTALSFSDLEARNLIETIDDSERGSETGDVSASTATGDESEASDTESFENVVAGEVLLNEGANLQLRRNPNAQAESLGLIPAGEQVVVIGRTEDASWLQARYDGNTGWVAATYLRLTYNGQAYNVQGLPVAGTSAAATATVDPNATLTPTPEPTVAPTLAEINVDVVGMTIEPGGSGEGLPVLTRGRQVYFYYNSPDGLFSMVELVDDGTIGWVPSNSLFFR